MRFYLKLIASIAILSCLMASPAGAMDIYVGPKVGTLGLGAEVGFQLSEYLTLRAIAQGFGYDKNNSEVGDASYDAHLQLLSFGGIADLHPFAQGSWGKGFRLSAGLLYNGNQLKLDGEYAANETVTIGNQSFTGADLGKVHGFIEGNKIAPYLGIGWGTNSTGAGWSVSADVGVLFQGSPSVKLKADKTAQTPASVGQQIDQEVKNEESKIEDDISWFQYYPVVMVGAVYRF